MKKLLITFAIVGVFTIAAAKVANAYYVNACGHTCWCDDFEDEMAWSLIYCDGFEPY